MRGKMVRMGPTPVREQILKREKAISRVPSKLEKGSLLRVRVWRFLHRRMTVALKKIKLIARG
jgi:hypothetical protein